MPIILDRGGLDYTSGANRAAGFGLGFSQAFLNTTRELMAIRAGQQGLESNQALAGMLGQQTAGIAEGLPPEMQQRLAGLQAAMSNMTAEDAATLRQVVLEEEGRAITMEGASDLATSIEEYLGREDINRSAASNQVGTQILERLQEDGSEEQMTPQGLQQLEQSWHQAILYDSERLDEQTQLAEMRDGLKGVTALLKPHLKPETLKEASALFALADSGMPIDPDDLFAGFVRILTQSQQRQARTFQEELQLKAMSNPMLHPDELKRLMRDAGIGGAEASAAGAGEATGAPQQVFDTSQMPESSELRQWLDLGPENHRTLLAFMQELRPHLSSTMSKKKLERVIAELRARMGIPPLDKQFMMEHQHLLQQAEDVERSKKGIPPGIGGVNGRTSGSQYRELGGGR